MVIPHYMGRSREVEVESENVEENCKGIKRQDSFASRSSLQDIPLLLPQEPDVLDDSSGGPISNGFDCTTTKSVSYRYQKAKIEPLVTDMPMKGFVDDRDSPHHHLKTSLDVMTLPGTKNSDIEWWETQARGDQVGLPNETGEVGPRTSCRCQVCCSSCRHLKHFHCRPNMSGLP